MYRSFLVTLIFTVLAMSHVDARMTRHHVPYFLSANHPTLHSIVRLTWRSCRTGPEFRVDAYDDSGAFRGTLKIPYSHGPNGCGEIVEFNSFDLENGNPNKGFIGVGQGVGDWQLFIESTHPVVKVSSYVSTEDGFMVPMHDTVPFHEDTDGRHITTFNFADAEHEGRLRIINPNDLSINRSDSFDECSHPEQTGSASAKRRSPARVYHGQCDAAIPSANICLNEFLSIWPRGIAWRNSVLQYQHLCSYRANAHSTT